jgi:hypothetical protein
MMVDPPQGWRYGFPKEMPDDEVDMTKWLLDNGYPKDLMESYGKYFFVRMWKPEE